MIKLNSITKIYDSRGLWALKDVNVELTRGKITAIIGPSGAGKSTLLKIIAGLEVPSSGSFEGAQKAVYLSQEWTLPGELTVNEYFEDLAGPQYRELYPAIRSLVEVFHLQSKVNQRIEDLSTGQKGRAYLVGALMHGPELVLLDEPFAHLDQSLRLEIERELRELQRRFHLSLLVISHDLSSLLSFADQVLMLKDGRVHFFGAPEEFYLAPPTLEVATFPGGANLLAGPVVRKEGEYMVIRSALGEHRIARESWSPCLSEDARFAYIFFRAQDVELLADRGDGVVMEALFNGECIDYVIRLKSGTLIKARTWSSDCRIKEGVRVGIQIPSHKLRLLPV
jgi:putative spermidine/putrescine transport system ATP-binding protein